VLWKPIQKPDEDSVEDSDEDAEDSDQEWVRKEIAKAERPKTDIMLDLMLRLNKKAMI